MTGRSAVLRGSLIGACLAALTACSGGGGHPSAGATPGVVTSASAKPSGSAVPSASPTPTPTATGAGPLRCHTAQLSVSHSPAGAATGHVSYVVTFRNASHATCTLFGYPGMQLLDAAGHPIPTDVHRGLAYAVPDVPEQTVVLAPGAFASYVLGFADATGYGEAQCPTSARVQITPPNAYEQLTVDWQLRPYGGPTIQQLHCGELNVSPVYPGAGRPSG